MTMKTSKPLVGPALEKHQAHTERLLTLLDPRSKKLLEDFDNDAQAFGVSCGCGAEFSIINDKSHHAKSLRRLVNRVLALEKQVKTLQSALNETRPRSSSFNSLKAANRAAVRKILKAR